MPFDKPKVVIDLEEYLKLKKSFEQKEEAEESVILVDLITFIYSQVKGEEGSVLDKYNAKSKRYALSLDINGRLLVRFKNAP